MRKYYNTILSFLKTLFGYWKKFAHVVGMVNSTIILTVFYFTIFGLYSLFSRIFLKKEGMQETYWKPKKQRQWNMAEAGKPF